MQQGILDKASDTLYSFLLTDLPSVITRKESRNLILNCNTCYLPGISLGTTVVRHLGGYINTPSNDLSFDSLSLTFLVDEDLENWKTLFKWMLFMHNNKDKFAVTWDEACVNGILTYYNNWVNKNVMEITYERLWPTSLSQIQLTNKTDGSQYLECTCSFTFNKVNFGRIEKG